VSSPAISTQHACYQATSLSIESVAKNSKLIAWETQPSLFKKYPQHLFRYAWKDKEVLKIIQNARKITSKMDVVGSPYYRLNSPSAGNLQPLELYVQIRGIKGILSGIYHVDVESETLVLLLDIETDGLETYVGMKHRFSGMIFILSTVYFRSYWKYGLRALRYIYLDAGHQIAALQASIALEDKKATVMSGFDVRGLNHFMGFEKQERVVAVLSVGTEKQRIANPMTESLMTVQPTDYCSQNISLQTWIEEAKVYEDKDANRFASCDKKVLETFINYRRSAREFTNKHLADCHHKALIDSFRIAPSSLNISYALFDFKGEDVSLYDIENIYTTPYKRSNAQELVNVLLNQVIVASSSIIIFISSDDFNEQVLMQAGKFGHQLYLDAFSLGLGCSGIGAFYDNDLNTIIEEEYILYACVIGAVV